MADAIETRHIRRVDGRTRDRTAVVTTRLGCAGLGQRNPFNGLNLGVVSVEDRGAGIAVRFELVTYDTGGAGAVRVAYDSGWL